MNVEFSPIGWLDRCKILVAKATEIGPKKIKGKNGECSVLLFHECMNIRFLIIEYGWL